MLRAVVGHESGGHEDRDDRGGEDDLGSITHLPLSEEVMACFSAASAATTSSGSGGGG